MITMKKSLLAAAGAALATIAVSVFVYANNVKNEANEFFNANVETLARNEGSGNHTCYRRLTLDPTFRVKYCGTCTEQPGKGADKSVCY